MICPDEEAALSCAEPLPTVLDRYTCLVRVLFPSRVPPLATSDEVREYPGLGVLSLCYHGTDPEVAEAFVAGTRQLPPDQAKVYYNYAYSMAAPAVRKMMEDIVINLDEIGEVPLSPSYQRVHDEGKAEGKIHEKRSTVFVVLQARGLEPTADQRRLVETCEDLATLQLWVERGITATSTADVFR